MDLIDEWKKDFKGYIDELDIPRDDYNGIMEYIDEVQSAQPETHEEHTETLACDLISRQAAIDAMGKAKWAKERLMELPSAQPEIIRCKDCKFSHMTINGECKYCDIWFPDEKCYMSGDYYCGSAERREE